MKGRDAAHLKDAPPAGPTAREGRDAVTQRIRVGLTGLAAVFLLTMLAASLFNILGQDEHPGGRADNGMAVSNVEEPPREPLAELGMAPGNAPRPATDPRPVPTLTPPAPTGPGLVPVAPAKH